MTGAASPHDVAAFRAGGSWRELERVAQAMVASAQDRAGTPLIARLGGGTRLMLALEHRISNDIDLFIRDPQWIGYLTPRTLFDWWAIETHAPARVPVSAMARLLHGKMPDIEAALRSLTTSPAAARGWDAVRASARPRFDIAVAWAMQRLNQYAGA